MITAVKRAKSAAFQRARLNSLPYNLVKSGKLEKYYKLLADFNFISQKINHPSFGVQALIEDYDLIDWDLPIDNGSTVIATIGSNPKPLKLNSLRYLVQRWFSP